MSPLRNIVVRLVNLFRRDRLERELDAELRAYLELWISCPGIAVYERNASAGAASRRRGCGVTPARSSGRKSSSARAASRPSQNARTASSIVTPAAMNASSSNDGES